MSNRKYEHTVLRDLRAQGLTWEEIGGRLGVSAKRLSQAHGLWKKRYADAGEDPDDATVVQMWKRTDDGTVHIKYPQPSLEEAGLKEVWADFLKDAKKHAPAYSPVKRRPRTRQPMLGVANIYDAHFGLKADARETGDVNQDVELISDDFRRAVDHFVLAAESHPIDRWMIPLGHDLSHINHHDGKTGVTAAGTAQDVDTRLWNIFTAMRRASVYMIDALRSTGAPVDVVMVPGNHDEHLNFQLGEVLAAWYRRDRGVSVENSPRLRKFYGYGANAVMLYHGHQYNKKGSGNPITIMATECPADLWVASESGAREILSGHFHKRMQGRYTPTADMDEGRGIVARSLPGLTAGDQWHYAQGYAHRRAATLLVYRKSGGLELLHEFQP